MVKLPKFKKTLSSFFLSEEGKTSKKKMFKTGVLIAGISTLIISSSSSVAGCKTSASWGTWIYENIYEDTETNPEKHASHASHGSHGSHASHGSHGSHFNWGGGGGGPCSPCQGGH